ncbi:MAG: PGDYG domain-containing protein [Planctomycetaceae bacterium]
MTEPAAHTPLSNKALLDEVNSAGLWFRARKTKPLWAKRLDRDDVVTTLEGTERVSAGDYLCRGPAGEIWPQKGARLEKTYRATNELNAEGWRRFEPRPDAEGALAAQMSHPFTVQAAWGELTGKPGDYLVKDYSDHAVAYPADVWIVDRVIFEATYSRM